MKKYNFYVYILECVDKSYYTGVTNNVDRRLSEHENGFDPECYTTTRRPVKLVLIEEFTDIREAIGRETNKKMVKKEKRSFN